MHPGLGVGGLDEKTWTHGSDGMLLLPGNFGKIYIGQVFSCYISVCNNGLCPQVNNVVIKAELEANGQRLMLVDKREKINANGMYGQIAVAKPNDTIDLVIEQELVNMGMHTLRVNVEFDSSQAPGSRRSIRKHYKFQVDKPISFSCRFENAGNKGVAAQKLLAQVSIKNLTNGDLLLQHVEMNPKNEQMLAVQGKTVQPFRDEDDKENQGTPLPVLLNSGAVQRYIFHVQPKAPDSASVIQPGDQVGQVLSRWRTGFAEQGRLMSQPLVWRAEQSGSIHMRIPPVDLIIGESSTVQLHVTNVLDQDMDAHFHVEPHQKTGVLISGKTDISLGVIPSKGVCIVPIEILPLSAGLHTINVTITDNRTSLACPTENLPSIYVSGK